MCGCRPPLLQTMNRNVPRRGCKRMENMPVFGRMTAKEGQQRAGERHRVESRQTEYFYCIVRGMASTKTVHEFIAIPPCMGWTMDECNQWPTENIYCHIDLKLSFHKHPSIKQVLKWFQTILCSSKDLLPSGVAEVWRWSANDAEKKSDIKNKVLIYWRSKRSAKLLLYCCIVGLSWIWNKFSHCLSYTICGTLHAASSHIYWRFGFQRFYLFFYYYFQYNVRGRLLSISKESKWKKKKK